MKAPLRARGIAFVLFFLIGFAWAQEAVQSGMVNIKADQLIYEKNRITASGHAVVTYETVRIESKAFVYDLDSGVIESLGEVVFKRPGETTTGKQITYDVKTGVGSLEEISGQTKNIYLGGEPIRGTLFYKAASIQVKGNVITLKNAAASTCDYPWGKKHYQFTADAITVYPGDKMILSGARLWVGKKPIYRMGKLVIDLHPRTTRRQSYLPHFGYDPVDGTFIKTSTNYMGNQDGYGAFLFDYYARTGIAAGIDQHFPVFHAGSSEIQLYHQVTEGGTPVSREQVTSNSSLDFGHGIKANGSVNFFRFRVPPVVSPDSFTTQASLSRQGKRNSWFFTESGNVVSTFTNTLATQFHDWHDFGNDLRLDISESYDKAGAGLLTQSSFHNLTSLSKQFKGWSADLTYDKTNAPLFNGDFLNRTPEMTVHTDGLQLPFGIPFFVSADYGNFFESLDNIKTSRMEMEAGLPFYSLRLSPATRVMTSSDYKQDYYGTGNSRRLLNNQTIMTSSLNSHTDAMLTYQAQSTRGSAPFLYDLALPYDSVGGSLSFYNRNFWRMTIGTTYDYRNHFYQQFLTRLELHPKPNWNFYVNMLYDPNLHLWRNMISQVDFTPFHGIRLQYWSSYALPNGRVGYQDIGIVKEWHDWEAKLVYRWHRQEVLFFVNLKAFPEQQVPLGINPMTNIDPNSGVSSIQAISTR